MKKLNSKVDEAVGAKVRMIRLSRGMNAEELAEEIDMPTNDYLNCESGLSRFNAEVLMKLCKTLDTSSEEIFSDIVQN